MMKIGRKTGNKLELWIISHEGYCWHETYGQSMTDWANLYTIDRLLKLKKKEIIQIENTLPMEIGSMKKLLNTIITEIQIEEEKNSGNKKILDAVQKIPLIKKMIEDLG